MRIMNPSLKTKTMLLIMLTGFAVLLSVVITFSGYEYIRYRQAAENEALVMARIIALNSQSSLSFQDTVAAEETLASLNAERNVVCVALYNADNRLFSHTRHKNDQDEIAPETISTADIIGTLPLQQWSSGTLQTLLPVMLDKQRLGTVRLLSRQADMQERIHAYAFFSAGIFAFSALLAYLIAVYSQRFITKPVRELQTTMQTVTATKNYAIRAQTKSQDELGILARHFNGMLDQIQSQDRELREHREQLEENVRLRTQELSETNEHLQQTIVELEAAKNRAEEASRAKMQFLANISHEVRTPMNGVLGMAEILKKSQLTEHQRQLLQTLHQSGRNMLGIINDLLDFSKLEAGKFDLHVSTFDLHTLLDNTMGTFAATARDKQLDIATIIQPDTPQFIQGDPDRIRQILVNLIGNALKFTERGSVQIRADLEGTRGLQGILRLVVEDTGPGISETQQDTIFSPFTQVDDSMTRNHGGTGLGLAIVRQLTTLMDGDITLHSAPGQGARFTITLPFVFPEEPHPLPEAQLFRDITICSLGISPLSRTALTTMGRRYALPTTHMEGLRQFQAATIPSAGKLLVVVDDTLMDEDLQTLELLLEKRTAPYRLAVLNSSLRELRLPRQGRIITKPLRQSEMQILIFELAEITVKKLQHAPEESGRENVLFDARVLLVEDNEVNQQVAREALELFGLTVTTAGNGQEALDNSAAQQFDLIFMDCQMPVMDGYTASNRIRQRENIMGGRTRVPIIALTAHALTADRHRCFQNGMDDYMSKPFTLASLNGCLQRWLAHRQLEPRAGMAATEPAAPMTQPAAGSRSEDRILDQTILDNLRKLQANGTQDLLQRLFATYTRTADKLMHDLLAGMAREDVSAVKQQAHTLKSSSFNVGAVRVAKLAAEIEVRAQAADVDGLTRLGKQLEEELAHAMEAINRMYPNKENTDGQS